ncbi:MAG TPA: ANTAR domain-containing protein [Actinocrinis sp.]|nr:ANTAR domain-containing protein [Actinocrinis sp.]
MLHQGQDGPMVLARAAEVLEVDGLALALFSGEGASELLWCTNETVQGVEDLQLTLGEGPGIEAGRTKAMVSVPDLVRIPHQRWPGLAAEAVGLVARAVFCFPVGLGAIGLGVLTAVRLTPGPLTGGQVEDARALADALAVRALDDGGRHLDGRHPNSSHALTRAEVHQATGMLSVQLAVSLPDALLRLRAHAYSSGHPLTEICQDIVDRRLRLGPHGEGATPAADKECSP